MSGDKKLRENRPAGAESEGSNADDTLDSSVNVEEPESSQTVDNEPWDDDSPASENDQVELTQEDRLESRIAELEADKSELTDGLLRKSADFENYRKRMLREKEEFVTYANRELLVDIVSIVDDFDRAIRSADESHDFTAFHDGIAMIEKQFTSMLERKWKLIRFDSVGEEFDPQRHEAVMTEEQTDHEQSVVLEDFQKGYMLQEKVLRPAKVKVSLPRSQSDRDTSAQNE